MGEINGLRELRELLEQFIRLEEDEVVAWLQGEGLAVMDNEATPALLAQLMAEAPPDERPHWQARLELLQTLQRAYQQVMTSLLESPLSMHLQGWIETANWNSSEAYLRAHADLLLTDEAEALLAMLLAMDEEDEIFQLHQQLLAACRQQGIDTAYAQVHAAQNSQMQGMHPLLQILQGWIETEDWAVSAAYLREHAALLLTDEAEAVLTALTAANEGHELFVQHQQLLANSRREGIEAAYTQFLQATLLTHLPDFVQPLMEQIDQWIRTPSWTKSEAYLREHEAALLSDEGEAILAMLVAASEDKPENGTFLQHQQLLADSRREGIAAAYAQFQATRLPNLLPPLVAHIGRWMDTTTWNDSEAYLRTHEAELLTDEAEATLMMLIAASEGRPEQKGLAEHQQLLAACRQQGIATAYEAWRTELLHRKQADLEAEAENLSLEF